MSRPAGSALGKVWAGACFLGALGGFAIGKLDTDTGPNGTSFALLFGAFFGALGFAAAHDIQHRRRGEEPHALRGRRQPQ